MDTSLYVALSGQLALERRMQGLAQNVANANTAGYRAAGLTFRSIVSDTAKVDTAFASAGADAVDLSAGGLTRTGNPLDVAVRGSGFFAVQGPDQVYYSRDGRFSLSPEGQLMNASGHLLLDSGGSALQLDPAAGPPTINGAGRIFQNGQAKGQIGLYALDVSAGFTRTGNAGLVPKLTPEAVVPSAQNGVVQGFVEDSNVSPVTEMVRLIQVTRAFESVSTMLEKAQDTQRSALQVLASRG